jgi:hypothetical protein
MMSAQVGLCPENLPRGARGDSRWLFPDEVGEPHFLDYETRGRADLPRVGTSIYATEAEVLLTAVCRSDSEAIAIEGFEAPDGAVVISWGIFDFHIYRALPRRAGPLRQRP